MARVFTLTDADFARFLVNEGVEYAMCEAGYKAEHLANKDSDLYRAAKRIDSLKGEWHQAAAALRWAAEVELNKT